MLRQNKGVSPILLLDDLFDKLDAQRVTHLIRLLTEGQFGQIFITDTHETRIAEIVEQFGVDYRRFFVEAGTVDLQTG